MSDPIAYLYHDAESADVADPLTHSTLLVMRAQRLPSYRNETPLVTLAQAEAMVAAERERWAAPLRRMWPLLDRITRDYVFTAERAGEVTADMEALRGALKPPPMMSRDGGKDIPL